MSTDTWAAIGTWAAIAVSIAIAIAGGVRARAADRRARDADARSKVADQRADEALELARSAEARADRLERVAMEKRDVAWAHRPLDDTHGLYAGTLSFENIGTDPAHDVVLVVDSPQGRFRRQQETFTHIEAAGRIGINLAAIAREAEAHSPTIRGAMGLEPRINNVRVRVTWRSESGVPGIQEWDSITL